MTEPINTDIIIAREVHKWFGGFHALRGVNLDVKRGQVVVVFGPSGSGKSTFIRVLNRLEEHQRGQIIVDGIELTNDIRNIEAIRSEIGMVFQQFNLFPHLTVAENISLAPVWVRKWEKDKAEKIAQELLERVGIPEQAHKYPGQLSGGQQQRVAIARALAMQPKIMLFDEP
ncbi:MAG: amino acid ABC transporter ATP-binding protein, partial [Chloroflexi bacterium]|nr:amino acid ABC transporter ATP-binding protein [Chloroflexota bacterium]